MYLSFYSRSIIKSYPIHEFKATVSDISQNVKVDVMGADAAVLDMIRNNPKIKTCSEDGLLYFSYISKFQVR